MQYLNWVGEHPFLTVIVLGMITETIIRLFRSGQIRAIKCPACGYKRVLVDMKDDKDDD